MPDMNTNDWFKLLACLIGGMIVAPVVIFILPSLIFIAVVWCLVMFVANALIGAGHVTLK